MLNAINSDQMVQQAMRGRGFGRRRGPEGEGFGPPPGPRPEGAQAAPPRERMQAFIAKYGCELPEGLGQGAPAFRKGQRANVEGAPQLSFADGRPRGPRHAGLKDNPQMAAAMEALKQLLDKSRELPEEEKQAQLTSWAAAYDIPVPPPGSKWFWEV